MIQVIGYNGNHHYYLDLGPNNRHQKSFNSFNSSFYSDHSKVLKTFAAATHQFNCMWESKRAALENNHVYDAFLGSYNQLRTEITSVISVLKNIEPGRLPLPQCAAILTRLAHFTSDSARVSCTVNDAVKQMIPYWFNESGQLISPVQPAWYDVMGHTKNWWNDKEYNTLVSGLESGLNNWHQGPGRFECADNLLYQRQNSSVSSPLLQMADIKDLSSIDSLCQGNRFEQAYQIVQKHELRFAKNPQDNFFRKAYDKNFHESHDRFGIKNEYLSDPIILTFRDLKECHTASHHNEQLKSRYDTKNQILRACNICQPSKQLERVIYEFVDDYRQGNYAAVINSLSKELCADSSNIELRKAYFDLVNSANGAFKFLNPNAPVSRAQLPASIHEASNADLRMVVNRLGLIDTSSPSIQSHVTHALEYVKHALNNPDSACRSFAHRITQALEKGVDDPVLNLPDFCVKLSDQNQTMLTEKVAGYIADKLEKYDQCADIYIQKTAQAYQNMIKGDSHAQILLEKMFGQPIQENVLLIDMEQLKAKVTEVNEDFSAIFDRLTVAYQDVAAHGLISAESYIQTDAATRLCLLERGINPLIYERFSGDQIQQVWHQLDVKALHVGGHLSLQAMPIGAKQMLEFGLQSNIAVHSFVKAKDFCNAFQSTTTALISYNYVAKISNICNAVDVGLKAAENTFIHMAKDPIGAAIDFGHGLINIARLVDSQARKFSEFGHNVIFNPEKAQQQLAEHNAEVSTLMHHIVETIEQKGLEGCVQDLTQFAAESVVLGQISNIAKAASIAGLEKIKPLVNFAKNEAAIAKTTIGTLENLGNTSSEICSLRQASNIVKESIRNPILQKISQREKVLEKVATYEQARNKALEIIGEVDTHTGTPHLGKQDVCKGKIVGRDWHGDKVTIRLDHDLVKGPHINVTDYRAGHGAKGVSIAIPFEGNKEMVERLLRHLNTEANLTWAKDVLTRVGDEKNLSIIKSALSKIKQG